jgi:hypothetical protein
MRARRSKSGWTGNSCSRRNIFGQPWFRPFAVLRHSGAAKRNPESRASALKDNALPACRITRPGHGSGFRVPLRGPGMTCVSPILSGDVRNNFLFFPHLFALGDTWPIALTGNGSGPGCGRAAVTSHRGLGSHGPEGARQAGMPGVEPTGLTVRPAAKGRRGGRMSSALHGQGIWDRPTGRQTPDGRALEASVLLRIRARFNGPPVFPPSSNGQTGNGAWRW